MADKNLLLVEGSADSHVVYHLAQHYHIQGRFAIRPKEGVEQLIATLDVELLASGLERLGIVVDADTDLAARWQSLRDALIRAGYTGLPADPTPQGTIVRQDGLPVVGIWIMPDNTLPAGMLEHFVGFLVPEEDRLWGRAGKCVEDIPEPDRRFPIQHQAKAHVHTWLAWQEEPGKPMGQAITKRYLDADALHARQFVEWLCQLFEL